MTRQARPRRLSVGDTVTVTGGRRAFAYRVCATIGAVDSTRVRADWQDANISRRVWFYGTGRPVRAKDRHENLQLIVPDAAAPAGEE